MKWLLTRAILATMIASPALAARQHLNGDDYSNVIPVAQIFPPDDSWNYVNSPLDSELTMQHWPSRPLPGFNTAFEGSAPRLPIGSRPAIRR
jgi:hypothetical protein